MIKAAVILFAIFFISNSHSVECGTYQFSGVVRVTKKFGHQLVMKEKSHSEIRLNVPQENLMLFLAYLNKYISGEIQIDNDEKISNPKSFRLTIPDPLVTESKSAFRLINQDNCKK